MVAFVVVIIEMVIVIVVDVAVEHLYLCQLRDQSSPFSRCEASPITAQARGQLQLVLDELFTTDSLRNRHSVGEFSVHIFIPCKELWGHLW